jgi:hypothetical protein
MGGPFFNCGGSDAGDLVYERELHDPRACDDTGDYSGDDALLK